MINQAEFLSELHTQKLGRGQLLFADELTSTNDVLKQMALENAPVGSLVVCDYQTSGRGRRGRNWIADRNQSLLFSILLKPAFSADKAALCTLGAAVAMASAIEKVCDQISVGIKWPNDLILNNRKCAGILCEMQVADQNQWQAICGIGVNVSQERFPEEIQNVATSLLIAQRNVNPSSVEISFTRLLCTFLAEMERILDLLEQNGFDGISHEYVTRCVTLHQMVNIAYGQGTFKGLACCLDKDGALILQKEDGEKIRVICGDASVRGIMGYCD